jgi:purine-binding chemotaxis protein CheW
MMTQTPSRTPAQPQSATIAQSRQLCTFWLDGLTFGVDVRHVQEVLRFQELTVVPLAPESVHGLINLRGQIVTAIDLRTRLALPAREDGTLPMNVIVRTNGEVQSLLVDDIGDVIDTSGYELEATPANLPPAVRDVLHGVLSLPETILLVLDPDRAVEVTTVLDATGGTS